MSHYEFVKRCSLYDEQTRRAWNKRLNEDTEENKDLCFTRTFAFHPLASSFGRAIRPRWYHVELILRLIQGGHVNSEHLYVILPVKVITQELMRNMVRDPFFHRTVLELEGLNPSASGDE